MSDERINLAHRHFDGNSEPYHYTMCGLDNVYLYSGFTRHADEDGEGISIDNIDDLHRAIVLHLLFQRKYLKPRELRFLRKRMDWTQAELAGLLGIDAQTVARYEKGETPINPSANNLVKYLCLPALLREEDRHLASTYLERIRKSLEEDDSSRDRDLKLTHTQEGWHETAL